MKSVLDRIYEIKSKWYMEAPYLATFLIRMKYISDEKLTETMGIGVINGRLTLVYNEKWVDTVPDEDFEGLLYHEIRHITALNKPRFKAMLQRNYIKLSKEVKDTWNVATDCVNNEDIVNTRIGGKLLTIPPTECLMENIRKQLGYTGSTIAEDVFIFLYNSKDIDDTSEVLIPMQGNGSGKGEESDEEELSNEKESDGDTDNSEQGNKEKRKGSSNNEGEEKEKVRLRSFDDHSLLNDLLEDDEAMAILESVVIEARTKGWGTHEGGSKITIDEFARETHRVDPRKIIHNHVSKYFFSNKGSYHPTWTRKNRRGYPLPGKRRGEPEVYVFMDVSGSTFNRGILRKFFNELDYLAERKLNLILLTWDIQIVEKMRYKKNLWRTKQFGGGGGTDAQSIFDWLKNNGKIQYPSIIFTDGDFDWNLDMHGATPFWVLTESRHVDRYAIKKSSQYVILD